MKAYDGAQAQESAGEIEKLPAGGYIAKILKAEVVQYTWGEVLVLSFDIADGPHKGHFRARWDRDKGSEYGQKWKGTFRLTVPSAASKYPEGEKRAFNNFIWAIQESNPGYRWDWKEASLAGKHIGVLFRNREWEKDGRTGWTTECCSVTSVQKIRAEDFKVPKDKPLKRPSTPAPQFGTVPDPFGQSTSAAARAQSAAQSKELEDFADEILSDGEVPF